MIVVAADGSGDCTTLYDAFEQIRVFMDYTVTIRLLKGIYYEKVTLPAWLTNVEIVGEDADSTIITWDDHASRKNMGTFRTHTMRIDGNDITLRNLTIANTAGRVGQAVALHTEGDRIRLFNCRLLGNQDTFYTGGEGNRLYLENCYIEGTTDFIFGAATAWFEQCTLHCKANSYITAASTPATVAYGYIFNQCRITAADGVTKVYLGRPWRPYSATLFLNCTMGSFIRAAGWQNWRNPANERTARYGEYGTSGCDISRRAGWTKLLTPQEAAEITLQNVFESRSAWLPKQP